MQSAVANWLRSVLGPYSNRDIVFSHVEALLRTYMALSPRTAQYTHDDGRTQVLLCCQGTVPVLFKRNTYNIPIAFWVPFDYPVVPPVVYIVPTATMLVRPSKNVEVSGKCKGEYLDGWLRKSEGCNLADLCLSLQAVFSNQPPVFAKAPKRNEESTTPSPTSPTMSQATQQSSTATDTSSSLPRPAPRPAPRPPSASHSPNSSFSSNTASGSLMPPDSTISINVGPPSRPSSLHTSSSVYTNPVVPQRPTSIANSSAHTMPSTGQTPPGTPGRPPLPALPTSGGSPARHTTSLLPQPHLVSYATLPSKTVQDSPFHHKQSASHPPAVTFSAQHPLPSQGRRSLSGFVSSSPRPLPNESYSETAYDRPIPPERPVSIQQPYTQQYSSHPLPVASPAAIAPNLPPLNLLDEDDRISVGQSCKLDKNDSILDGPKRPENPELVQLRSAVLAKLTAAIQNVETRHVADCTQLQALHSDLLKGEPALIDEIQRLETVRDLCIHVGGRYREVLDRIHANTEAVRNRDMGGVDEIICSTTVVYNQLIDLIAEDNALEDTIYQLGRGLNNDTARIDLDKFLKRVRSLAKDQFHKRALINKILLNMAMAWDGINAVP